MNDKELLIVVNADDLGASRTINDAIFAAITEGVITSATLMANGPAFADAVATSRRFPQASIGVHLNLTEFAPLTSDPGLEPLLGPDGCFRRTGVYETPWSPRFHRAVVGEWSAQIAKALAAGVIVTHLDSHNHTHTVPALFLPLKAVQKRFGLRRVRNTWNVHDRAGMVPAPMRLKKRAWSLALRTFYRTTATDEFAGFAMFLRAVGEGSYAPATRPHTLELMVHPDAGDQGNRDEAAALRRDWTRDLGVRVRLVPYSAL